MNRTNEKYGLYTPQLEKDACGIGLIANLNGYRSQQLVDDALTMLENMKHRGACGCEPNSGDGAGILVHIPHKFFKNRCSKLGFSLPPSGEYGVASIFFPKDQEDQTYCKAIIYACITQEGFDILGYRNVPVDRSDIGKTALSTEPSIQQLFVSFNERLDKKAFDRKLYVLRNEISNIIYEHRPYLRDDFYISSFSSRTIVYKGQLTAHQLRSYYTDLSDPDFDSAIALIHSRFSTNTFPKWKLAQPFRCIAHNGEINTIQGNLNWWNSKEQNLKSPYFNAEEMEKMMPICDETNSDSSNFDNVLEFLNYNGRSMPHALMMMIPEAWQQNEHIKEYKKKFYAYHEALMEPWDGPASICFTDGTLVGATLDRNGLRPSRYLLTDDNVLILASETGVIPVDPAKVVLKNRLEPGKILVADLDEHRIIDDEELKDVICQRLPYDAWLKESIVRINELELKYAEENIGQKESTTKTKTAFGWTLEDEELILKSMMGNAKEPVYSMGSDIPLAVLSRFAQHISNYFKQQFAQVTNPPIDPLREREFMTLKCFLGGARNILNVKNNQVSFIRLESPVLSPDLYNRLHSVDHLSFKAHVFDATFNRDYISGNLKSRIEQLCVEAEEKLKAGKTIFIISNLNISQDRVPIPSLMVTGAIHHHLIEKGLRQECALVINGGDIFETHHFATLLGYGADAIYASMAIEAVQSVAIEIMQSNGQTAQEKAVSNYIKAVEKGLLKIMSKLGVSTVLSYKGAQTFEALGIADEVIDLCFKGTISRIQGMNFDMLAKEAMIKHDAAFKTNTDQLIDIGKYQWKRRGEYHLFNPKSIHLLQHSTRTGNYDLYKKYTKEINQQEHHICTLRSLFDFNSSASIPIDDVEPVEHILKRFATGAMSFGSISHEAHSTLAIAMNRIGGKSNSGEGGEDEIRFKAKENGDWERSAIKQVASGRFGVTIHYLTNAIELQIKMAQGAKPGEGGQLPGHKVDDWIARVRNSTPGVGLISPPPHHDIYSIEDLAQLIFDLKNANPKARISVKLVSKTGVGIIASGVTKGHADHILISGHDGGTGASPLSSISHAGLPWEIGIAETHQTLLLNKLRNRVCLQVDGQMRTGRDLAIATLLGAEEWGIATAALVVEGCILMRKCHLNTCPVGIATQDPALRKKFDGKVEHLVNYFKFLAQDLREIMASLGFKTINEMVGRTEFLKVNTKKSNWKLSNLDLEPILFNKPEYRKFGTYKSEAQDHDISDVLDRKLIQLSKEGIFDDLEISESFDIKNTDRATGAMLSNLIARIHGSKGLENDRLNFHFNGSAGQSFGAFLAKGVTMNLEGDANDYVGKGLSGGKLIITPPKESTFDTSKNIIIGNVALYGATSGEVFINGKAGERFAVRNSGALAVVEGVGAHGCEYMTGGRVIVLGEIGRNFAAGMSGGIAYVYDPSNKLHMFFNHEMIELEIPETSDFELLHHLLQKHLSYTNSKKAKSILEQWDKSKYQFIKIMPVEYKAALKKMDAFEVQQQISATK